MTGITKQWYNPYWDLYWYIVHRTRFVLLIFVHCWFYPLVITYKFLQDSLGPCIRVGPPRQSIVAPSLLDLINKVACNPGTAAHHFFIFVTFVGIWCKQLCLRMSLLLCRRVLPDWMLDLHCFTISLSLHRRRPFACNNFRATQCTGISRISPSNPSVSSSQLSGPSIIASSAFHVSKPS